MRAVVLDANAALDWFIPSEVGDAYSQPLAVIAGETGTRFRVPLHFDIEVARILVNRHKRDPQQFSAKWLAEALHVLDILPIDSVAPGINFKLLGELSKAYNLAVPDVPYFHLARMMEIPIASRDRGIVSACKAWHVQHWQPLPA